MNKIKCLVCGNSNIIKILNLGKSPLANNLISFQNARFKEKKYPLVMGQCKKCKHVQLKYVVRPKLMFDNYLYVQKTIYLSLYFLQIESNFL